MNTAGIFIGRPEADFALPRPTRSLNQLPLQCASPACKKTCHAPKEWAKPVVIMVVKSMMADDG